MKIAALQRVGRNVANLEVAQKFYVEALGFQPVGPVAEDRVLAEILGVQRARILRMRLGAQVIELSECFPAGAAYPRQSASNDLGFQHIAIVTTGIAGAYERVMRHGASIISTHGPVRLPPASGDVVAFKFRDPECHPLEFLQFPKAAGKALEGYDHSAISVSDVARSVAFYTELGLSEVSRQVNQGPEQDALDGLSAAMVDVVALQPAQATPHVELLGYRRPKAASGSAYFPNDIGADRLVFGVSGGAMRMLRDPDGHIVVLDGR